MAAKSASSEIKFARSRSIMKSRTNSNALFISHFFNKSEPMTKQLYLIGSVVLLVLLAMPMAYSQDAAPAAETKEPEKAWPT